MVESPRRPVVSVDPKALKKAREDILSAPVKSLDNWVDSLEVGINETSRYHMQWSPQTPGTHDYIHARVP